MNFLPALRSFLAHEWLVLQKAYFRHTNRERLLRLRYKEKFGKEPDLKNPRTLNEKVMWLMLHSDDTRWTELADKYRVRKYVKQCGLGYILNDLYAVWDPADEIDFDDPRLPDRFVLQANNGYGDVLPVSNWHQIHRKPVRRNSDTALRPRLGPQRRHGPRIGIAPLTPAERLLPANPAFGSTLVDYKFYCFDGKPRYCQVCYDRTSPSHAKKELFDAHTWEDLGRYVRTKDNRPAKQFIPRPESLDEMLVLAERLAQGFRMVRVDFYEVNGRPVFGEMTFTPAAGTSLNFNDEFQRILGDCLPLPECQTVPKHKKPSPLAIFNLRFLIFNFAFVIFALLCVISY